MFPIGIDNFPHMQILINLSIKRILLISALFLMVSGTSLAQVFTRLDSIAGGINPGRDWWDLVYYHLMVEVQPDKKSISGTNEIHFRVLKTGEKMQLEMQDALKITAVTFADQVLNYTHKDNIIYLTFPETLKPGEFYLVQVDYQGKPEKAKNPPWEAGFTWTKDSKGSPWIVSTSQGSGTSMWWPGKHHPYDEPDSMLISVTVPKPFTAVANGRLREKEVEDDKRTFHWFVSSPINNYAVNLNIGHYVHFSDIYAGEAGIITCDYYVLPDNLDKAIQLFPREVPRMFRAFEYWFGPYPFYKDGYKLVEVPYAGMEHQSAVTYGNKYENGYLGRDLSNTNWGYTFDFIIIHESGHEWFANSITNADIADMWIHESFTTYAENLFLDYHYGSLAASEYVIGTRENIRNDRPVQGPYGVNTSGSPDMYYKGANALHTLRSVVNNDTLWRQALREMNRIFYHQTVNAADVVSFLSEYLNLELQSFFHQYFQDTRIPVFEYKTEESRLQYRWTNIVEGFALPVEVYLNGSVQRLQPQKEWKDHIHHTEINIIEVNKNWYVGSNELAD